MPTMSDPGDEYTSKIYLGDSHDKPLSTQGGPCPSGECHARSSHCGRCGGCSGYQGHHFSYCKVTKTTREFHFCCPDDCELETETMRRKDHEQMRPTFGDIFHLLEVLEATGRHFRVDYHRNGNIKQIRLYGKVSDDD